MLLKADLFSLLLAPPLWVGSPHLGECVFCYLMMVVIRCLGKGRSGETPGRNATGLLFPSRLSAVKLYLLGPPRRKRVAPLGEQRGWHLLVRGTDPVDGLSHDEQFAVT